MATWLGIGMLGVVGVLSLTAAWRWRVRNKRLPALSAKQQALEKLSQIRPESLNGRESYDRAYSLLSDAVRHFLHAGLQIGSPQQSTPEMIATVNKADRLLESHKRDLTTLLARSDEIRFGRSPASAEETASWLASAKSFIEEVGRISIRPAENRTD